MYLELLRNISILKFPYDWIKNEELCNRVIDAVKTNKDIKLNAAELMSIAHACLSYEKAIDCNYLGFKYPVYTIKFIQKYLTGSHFKKFTLYGLDKELQFYIETMSNFLHDPDMERNFIRIGRTKRNKK